MKPEENLQFHVQQPAILSHKQIECERLAGIEVLGKSAIVMKYDF